MKIPAGWSQTPNEIIAAMPLMSGSEFKCTMVLIRETYGYHRRQVKLTYRDFTRQTGIKSRETLAAALKAVDSRGFFRRGCGPSKWMIGDGSDHEKGADGSMNELREAEKCSIIEQNESTDSSIIEQNESTDSSIIEQNEFTNSSIIEQNRSRNSSKIEQNVDSNSSKIEQLQLYKERSPLGKEREGERKGPPTRKLPRTAGGIVHQEKMDPEWRDGADSVCGGKRVMHPKVPRPRTAVERDLATRPGTAVWLDCGLAWPGWYTLNVITKRLGEKPQIEVLKKAREMWAMAGYRQTNFEGILDWYDALCRDPSWRPFTRTKGQSGRAADGKNGPCSPTMAMLLDMEQELTHGKRSDHDTMFDSAAVSIPADGVWRGVGEDLPDDAGRY